MELSMQLQQKQTLNRRQQQSVEILQMNALALSDYAKEAAEENPLLEWEEAAEPAQHHGAYGTIRAVPEGRTEGESLRSFLLFQINTKKMPEGHKAVLRFLAESTAESGYLEADAIAVMREKFPMQEKTAARILSEFQQLEPAGVGARNLRECLCIQLKRKGASPLACRLAEIHLEEIAKNRLSYLAKAEKVTMAEILAALEEIRECNPKPGSGFVGERPVEYILPDILVEQKKGVLTVSVNGAAVPRLSVNYDYKALLQEQADAETAQYLAEKQKQAEWMLECIRRRESTLRQVAEIIIKRQRLFFTEQKGALSPLRMADVAAEAGLHVSTVSRAVKGKYLQCDRGLFPLHAFFSQALQGDGGAVSADSVKEHLRQMIAEENGKKPLSDRELAERLAEEGIRISRRTVTKYREAMGLASANGRRKYAADDLE